MVAERLRYRWWVLVNTFLVFTIAIGMGGTCILSSLLFLLVKETGLRTQKA